MAIVELHGNKQLLTTTPDPLSRRPIALTKLCIA